MVETKRATAAPNERARKNHEELFPGHVSTLTRTGIDLPTRELLTFSMLVALGGCDPQVKGHVAANLRVGNGRGRLIEVVTQLLPFIGYPRVLNGLRAIDEAAPADEA
jgi:4-carboxymuconolactone decarboxylase